MMFSAARPRLMSSNVAVIFDIGVGWVSTGLTVAIKRTRSVLAANASMRESESSEESHMCVSPPKPRHFAIAKR